MSNGIDNWPPTLVADPKIKLILGYVLMELKKSEKAAHYFYELANSKNIQGAVLFGYCCELGIGVPIDLEKARLYYEQALGGSEPGYASHRLQKLGRSAP